MSLFSLIDKPRARTAPAVELNDDQQKSVEKINRFLNDQKARYFGLFGAAGTGKTTAIGQALYDYHKEIAFTAPTHKATGILASKAPSWIDCYTIHKLLGCKKHYDKENGNIEFRPSQSGELIGDYPVVVVDECSMIGETMWSWIEDAAERNGTKVIFLGDPYQLPPVNDGDYSPTFDIDEKMCHELTKIMRHQGVIQRTCDKVREAIIKGVRPPFAEEAKDDHGEIIKHRNSESGLAAFFERFLEHVDESKILAFKNDDVDFCNGYVRKMLYGDKAEKEPYIPGERLVLAETYESPTVGGVYHTGTECTLVDAEQENRLGLACWRLYLETDYGAGFEAFAFGSKNERAKYRRKIGRLKQDGKDGLGWRPYFEHKETFARVRPGYATTCHKSQGSTFDRVFLLQSELVGLWDASLLARLLYVSYSRARKEIVLV